MKMRTDNLPRPHEWALIAAAMVVAGLIYGLLVHPSLRMFTSLGQARDEHAAALGELEQARQQLDAVEKNIAAGRAQLAQGRGVPPPASRKDMQIARIAALATECGLMVQDYTPLGEVEEPDHLAFFVQFTARGEFAAVQRFFARHEKEIDFVDVTHFAITAPPAGAETRCQITWSCRINGTGEHNPTGRDARKSDLATAEVNLRVR